MFRTGICIGDVVVVDHPLKGGSVCKRVLGLPGDVVVRSPQSPYGRHRLSPRSQLLVVPDGHVWIEGDNTPNSRDSRSPNGEPHTRPMSAEGQPFTGSMVQKSHNGLQNLRSCSIFKM